MKHAQSTNIYEWGHTMNIGNNLKVLRKNKNITQEELAQYLSVSPQSVSKWENNISAPDISMLPVLADFYNISIDELLQYSCVKRKEKMIELSSYVHELLNSGKTKEAYEWLKNHMAEWSLSVGINHLFAAVIRTYAGEKQGEEKEQLLLEAIRQCEKVINLDQNETARTAQAKMEMCYCLFDLKRYKEAEKIAETLPSMYSSRERVLCKISTGKSLESNCEYAKKCLNELLTEITSLAESAKQ